MTNMYKTTPAASTANGTAKTVYDFRSDTVTKPTPEMLQAMMEAEVGDDVFDEDPTINELQRKIADMAGHEAALFCPTATMTNQIAIRTHLTAPPYTVICDHRSHIFNYEAAGVSFHCGAGLIPIQPEEGQRHLTAKAVEKHLILDDDVHHAPTKVICLENTLHGLIVPLDNIREITALAKKHDLKTHLDGARLWNASAATGIPIKEYTKHFDSISVCMSKGLGAPVGSVLIGNKTFIKKAKHFRKMYGGGWRQAGLLAGAALYALEKHFPAQLKLDHENAAYLAQLLGATTDPATSTLGFTLLHPVETNMVWLKSPVSAEVLAGGLGPAGVRVFGGEGHEVRLVLHHQVDRAGVEKFVEVVKKILDGSKA
ncbi:pyridoxal phosphate-dependent transferase [Phlyctochytrium arcticum]|nr:pyridoxal phosphate-dependent transferase [Phlyctochytrium arcticum]